MSEQKRKALKKIAKCLELGNSANVNEAAQAIKMAHRLMLKYGLEKDDIEFIQMGKTKSATLLPTDISQQILKNGLQLTVPLGRRWLGQISGTWTHFVQRAAVTDYATLGGHMAYRLLGKRDTDRVRRGYLFLGAYVDLGNRYTSPHFRAGTGWQY